MPHRPPLSSGLAPSQASGGLRSSQDCLAGIPPSRCWPNMWPSSQTAWGPGLSQSHPLGFSARFRSFITWERCGSGGWQRDSFRMPQGLGAGGSPYFGWNPALKGNGQMLLAAAGCCAKGMWKDIGGSVLVNKCGLMSNNALTHVSCSREARNKIALETIDPFSQSRVHIMERN